MGRKEPRGCRVSSPPGRIPDTVGGREREWEECHATRLKYSMLSFLHNFWIFSATIMGFSLRIFSAASAL